MTLHTTRKIKRIPFLETYLAPEMAEARHDGVRLFAGWGAKASGRRARAWASLLNGRAVQLEDGFLRSYGTGQTHPPISLVADSSGIYYDATRPSDLEVMLEQEGPLWSHERMPSAEQAEEALAQILANGLSKYNHAPKYVSPRSATRGEKRVLVIDQTAGDLSIKLGLAWPESFRAMLAAARAEHPGATIYVKTHPMVSSGRKSGHFHWLGEEGDIVKLTDPVEPISLIQEMDHVYVVSSTMGFEALMAGKPVTCFGMPWYAGWGVTDDRVKCPRRTVKRDLLELFAAAYMRYCRYIDPATRSAGDIFDAIRWLARQKECERQLHGPSLRGRLIGLSMRRWKQANLAPILGTLPQTVQFARGTDELKSLRLNAEDCFACWGANISPEIESIAQASGARAVRIEDGFIRSVGLGSDLIPPQSLVLDEQGIYFDPTKASGLEEILEHTEFTQADLNEARLVRQLIVENGVTKYNMEPRAFPEWENIEAQKVLVVGQVEDDASIRLGCTDIRTNLELLQAVREQHPEAFVIYKPHPDVWTGNRVGTIAKEQVLALADHVETMTSITSCIEASNALHTLTSLSGFDALLRGLEVVTYGQPFYAGWGLTKDLAEDAPALSRRTRRLTLDQLVAGTLLHYPIYWDPDLRGYTTARAVIRQLIERRASLEASGKLEKLGTGHVSRQLRKASILAKALLR